MPSSSTPAHAPARLLVRIGALAVAGLLAAGCADTTLVDRVAAIEASQDRLRTSLTELGAPDPDALASQEAVRAEVIALSEQVTALLGTIDALRSDVDASSVEADGRMTSLELGQDDVRGTLTTLQTDINRLESLLASLEAQLDGHRGDPFGHS